MTTEEQLRKIILDNYKSVREFALTCNIPYSTVHSILIRGVAKATISSIMDICNALNIDANSIATGTLEFKKNFPNDDFLVAFSEIDDYQYLNKQQKEIITLMIKTFKKQNSQ